MSARPASGSVDNLTYEEKPYSSFSELINRFENTGRENDEGLAPGLIPFTLPIAS